MDEAVGAMLNSRPDRGEGQSSARLYAAIDLGTNNCRLMIATPSDGGIRVVDSFSRIVRLGEGLAHSGRLAEQAMERALGALQICADKIGRRNIRRVRAVATQACRISSNSASFLSAVAERTGLDLEIISAHDEARLAVAGCIDLVDRSAEATLILDVGGGSTELSWLDLSADGGRAADPRRAPIVAWCSIPIGVVNLAERFPEAPDTHAWRRAMVEAVKDEVRRFGEADLLLDRFKSGKGQIVGTSGAITSLAGVHLNLTRYERRRVDGLRMTRADCDAAADRLAAMSLAERARHPSIGPDRADLVVAGASILQAVQELWPSDRMRVADRGLREGLLYSLIAEDGARQGAGRPRRDERRQAPVSPYRTPQSS